MTKLAYLECPTGLAGDMCLGALVHAGVPVDYLIQQLSLLGIANEYQIWAEKVHRNGQQATKVHVELQTLSKKQNSRDQNVGNQIAGQWGEEEGVDPHTTFDHPWQATNLASDRATDQVPLAEPHEHSSQAYPLHTHQVHTQHPHAHRHAHDHAHDDQGHPSPDASSHTGARHLPEIEALIKAAGLPAQVTIWSLAIFRQLAEAEGAVHGILPEEVHFHEVGATDAIVDIVGTCLGLDWLGIEQLYCSPMPVGGGIVHVAHGLLPVPTPAVLKLWEIRGVPVYSNGIERELVTPTGAAIATTLALQFGPPPPMILQKIGLGAGSRNLALPNIVRLWIGEGDDSGQWRRQQQASKSAPPDHHSHQAAVTRPEKGYAKQQHPHQETVSVLATQIDDLNPQAIGYLFEALFAVGALDVFTQAIGMKKSRPGILLTVICHPEQVQACESVVFRETTTLGIRHSCQQRTALPREIQTVQTLYGRVRIKVARQIDNGTIINAHPEYEDCAQIARNRDIPWREVYQNALHIWQKQQESTH